MNCETGSARLGTDRVMSFPTDHDVIAESMAAPERFEVIFDRHVDAIRRYLSRRVGTQLADELVAETFTTAFERRAACAGESALPWLYGVATNCMRRHRRTESRQLAAYARTGRDPAAPFDEDGIVARVDAEADGPRLAAALASLRRPHRDALLLLAFADLTYEEIAVAMDVPVGTVRTWIHRARAATRRHLGDGSSTTTPTTEGMVSDERA